MPRAPAIAARPPLRTTLLRWYHANQRDLPWRSARPDPYHVLVSEAMLQQTQVATVIAYFHRFLAAFPTVGASAAADEQRVLRLWQGLGYYRRARNLHAAAQAIVGNHAGQVPDSVAALAALPGVGAYTAGAVASIAFGRRAPILDGNVARVLARWFAITAPIDQPDVRRRLWRLAARLVPAQSPGDFNQALMELGALVCTPRQPSCLLCPIAAICRAHRHALVDTIPARLARRAPRQVEHHVLAIHRAGRLLFERRPDTGLWSGMWQLPTAEDLPAPGTPAISGNRSPKSHIPNPKSQILPAPAPAPGPGNSTAAHLRRWAHDRLGLQLSPPRRIADFTHQTTHRTIRFVVWEAQATGGRLRPGAAQWRQTHNVDDLPLPNPQRRALALLNGNDHS